MIAPDANLLIYAYSPKDPNHGKSRRWLEEVLSGDEPVGIPVLSIHAYMRVQTDLRGPTPSSFADAARTVQAWLAVPHVRILQPGERHWHLYRDIASKSRIRGSDLTDVAIAAIAAEYGAVIYSADGDFAKMPGVRWVNPLAT